MRLRYFIFISSLTLTSCGLKNRTDLNIIDLPSGKSPIFEELTSGDWFAAKCELLCDEEHGKFLDFEKLKKYGQYRPYDITQVIKYDSAIITFDFIADCCMNFAGGVQIRNDTLVLEYRPPLDSSAYGCDCSCDYRMVYRIDKKDKTWVGLKTDYKRRY